MPKFHVRLGCKPDTQAVQGLNLVFMAICVMASVMSFIIAVAFIVAMIAPQGWYKLRARARARRKINIMLTLLIGRCLDYRLRVWLPWYFGVWWPWSMRYIW